MIIYGKQVCLHALYNHSDSIKVVYVAKLGILPQDLYDKYKDNIKFLENKWAQAMSKGGNHQGILLELEDIKPVPLSQIKDDSFIVILDGLTDAGNIGAIVRTSYSLGVDAIVISNLQRLNFAPIVRTSAGALLDMPLVFQQNISDVMNELSQVGFQCFGASMEGSPVEDIQFPAKRALILGSEDKGISKKARQKLDKTVSIVMQREFDSLNVSAAAAILIHRMGYAIK